MFFLHMSCFELLWLSFVRFNWSNVLSYTWPCARSITLHLCYVYFWKIFYFSWLKRLRHWPYLFIWMAIFESKHFVGQFLMTHGTRIIGVTKSFFFHRTEKNYSYLYAFWLAHRFANSERKQASNQSICVLVVCVSLLCFFFLIVCVFVCTL